MDCIESVAKNNDDPTTRSCSWQMKTMKKNENWDNTRSSSWQMKTMKKNENWDNAFVKSVMESVEICNSLQTIVYRWGVPITSLHNHLYGITQPRKKGE